MAGDKNNVVATQGPTQVPKLETVFDVVSKIQKLSAMESRGSRGVPENFLSFKEQWDIWMIGFLKTVTAGLVTALFTPFFIGVVEKLIPVFGDVEPTFFDKMLGFMLTVGFPLTYATVVYQLGQYYTGPYTKKMIRKFIEGVIVGAAFKMMLIFMGFHFLALVVLDKQRLAGMLIQMKGWVPIDKLNLAYEFLLQFSHVLITSAYFVLGSTFIIQICIPILSIGQHMYVEWRNKSEDDFFNN